MNEYFLGIYTKPAIKGSDKLSIDDTRPDLMQEHYRLIREKTLTPEKIKEIDDMYKQWADLLFSGFNIVVQGPESKFSLLETFRARYLDSEQLLDWYEILANKNNFKKKNRPALPTFKIRTVRLHGLDPIKLETFVYALFGNHEEGTTINKRLQQGILEFVSNAKKSKVHYVFLIHSIDYFLRDCEEICDILIQLYNMLPKQIHILLSADVINASKRLTSLKFKLRLLFFKAPYTESFCFERSQLVTEFDTEAAGDQTLFTDRVDLQSLKDIHQALGDTGKIMLFILEDYVKKCESGCRDDDDDEDNDDDDDAENVSCGDNDENNLISKRLVARRRRCKIEPEVKKKKKAPTTRLEFQHLLRYCESNFIVRRGVALRNHLGELVDHNVISMDETSTWIKCLVDVESCKKFISFCANSH